jgi:hypothetical protein
MLPISRLVYVRAKALDPVVLEVAGGATLRAHTGAAGR